MAIGRKGLGPAPPEGLLESYDVIYKGGLRQHPRARNGKIRLEITADRFVLKPTIGSKGYWRPLEIPYGLVESVEMCSRTDRPFEGLAGGLNSRQLNQKNNMFHIPGRMAQRSCVWR